MCTGICFLERTPVPRSHSHAEKRSLLSHAVPSVLYATDRLAMASYQASGLSTFPVHFSSSELARARAVRFVEYTHNYFLFVTDYFLFVIDYFLRASYAPDRCLESARTSRSSDFFHVFYATAMYLLGVIEAYPTNKFISDEIDLLSFVQFIHFLGED